MNDLPEPPIEANVDLRDMDGFMLNVERLMSSELVAISTGDEFKAAVLLWCRAWKQMPAGSLPSDDKILAAWSGAGSKWKKVKETALRGFVLCSDGRLYHAVLCEDAKRAWKAKQQRKDAIAKRWDKEKSSPKQPPVEPGKTASPNDSRTFEIDTAVSTPNYHRQGQDRDRESNKDAAAERAAVIEKVLRSIGAWDDPNLRLHGGRIGAWLDAGADPDLDIIPTLQSILKRNRQTNPAWFPSGLNYFDKAVAEAVTRRTKPMPTGGTHDGTTPPRTGTGRHRVASDDERRDALAEVFADALDGERTAP